MTAAEAADLVPIVVYPASMTTTTKPMPVIQPQQAEPPDQGPAKKKRKVVKGKKSSPSKAPQQHLVHQMPDQQHHQHPVGQLQQHHIVQVYDDMGNLEWSYGEEATEAAVSSIVALGASPTRSKNT